MAYKKETLIEVAKELNEVLGLEPAIEVKSKVKIKDLKESILQAGQLIDPAEDEFTDNTWTILEDLGAASRPAKEYDREEADEEEEGNEQDSDGPLSDYEEEEEEEEEEKEEADEEEESLFVQVQKAKKLDELRAIAEGNKEFKKLQKKLDDYKGLQGTRQLKKDMFKELGVEPSAEAPKEEKKAGKKGGTRRGGTRRISEIVCENPDITNAEIRKKIDKEGYSITDATISLQAGDTRKVLAYLKSIGKLKK
jgi:hypothetical protein